MCVTVSDQEAYDLTMPSAFQCVACLKAQLVIQFEFLILFLKVIEMQKELQAFSSGSGEIQKQEILV